MNITEACGYKDSEGKFWDTIELAEKSNLRIADELLEEEVVTEIAKLFYECRGYAVQGEYVYASDFAKILLKYPDKVLSILWKVTKYNFNKKFNDKSNK